MTLTAIGKGLATYVVPRSWLNRSHGKTHSARYCYSVYLRHLVHLHECRAGSDPRAVAEIGPGASIGVGLAALIGGADQYFGFDVKHYAIEAHNLALFDELVNLFEARSPVPGYDEFPSIKPAMESTAFPHAVLDEPRLRRALAPDRLRALRAMVEGPPSAADSNAISYVAPWFASAERRPTSIDWIFSQAVMEHVDDLETTYAACFDWLKPGGVMSHQIDFKSHGTASAWNGHWAYSDLAWRMVRGARHYLINRAPYSTHIEAIKDGGFEILTALPIFRDDGLTRSQLASRYRALSDEDIGTAGAFVMARRPRGDTTTRKGA